MGPVIKEVKSKVAKSSVKLVNLVSKLKLIFIDLLLDDVITNPQKINISIYTDFETGCWFYREGKHNIMIGDKIKPQDIEFIEQVFCHEISHMLWTDKKLSHIKKELEAVKIPFTLLNIFEDARIEYRWRTATRKKFNWVKWEKLVDVDNEKYKSEPFGKWKLQPEVPLGYLMNIIKSEDYIQSIKDKYSINTKLINRIYDHYYTKIKATHTTRQLKPLMVEWVKEFGLPENIKNEHAAGSVMIIGESLSGKELKELTGKSIKVLEGGHGFGMSEGLATEDAKARQQKSNKFENHPLTEYSNGDLLQTSNGTYDISQVPLLVSKYKKAFVGYKAKGPTEIPGKKLNIRSIISRKPDIYIGERNKSWKSRKIALVVDTSGSMGGEPISNARLLVRVLSDLTRSGYCSGHVILSGVRGKSLHQTFKLPITEDIITRIPGNYGAEGIEQAFKGTQGILKKADYVLTFTDGHITDTPMNREYWHAMNICSYGLYVNSNANLNDYRDSLLRHFDRVIAKKNMMELTDRLIRMIRY